MNTLKIRNSLTKKNEEFKLKKGSKLCLYLCGPTVYDDAHIGNIRPSLIFDIIVRLTKEFGVKCKYIQNITDVDDKIIEKARIERKSEKEISSFYKDKYFRNIEKLNIINPEFHLVTDNINSIIEFIKELIKNKSAYILEENVLFNIQNFYNEYGKLSKQILGNLSKEQYRKINEVEKNDKKDFVLWKKTSEGISWESPWFDGRPGWHTECVTLINKFFKKETIDIHGGGKDLLFPHHENERIQYKAYNGKELSKSWIHFGHVNFKKEKMSKSLGNFIKVESFIEKYGTNSLRISLLNAKYSDDIEFDEMLIKQSVAKTQKIENIIRKINYFTNYEKIKFYSKNCNDKKKILNYLLNNLEVTKVITILDENVNLINKNIESSFKNIKNLKIWISNFVFICKILGINVELVKYDEKNFEKITEWKRSVKENNFIKADKLRSYLQKKKIL